MKQQKADYTEIVDHGVSILIKGFSLTTKELFEEFSVLSVEKNPFASLPPPIKMAIVQNAFYQSLAQCLASLVVTGKGQGISEKEIFSSGTMVLRHHFDAYVKEFKNAKKSMDKGPEGGGDHLHVVPDPKPKGTKNKKR